EAAMASTTTEGAGASRPAAGTGGIRAPARVRSIDVLRGLVIVLMALDHVRDYFTNVRYEPTDLAKTSVALFFTRWITHYCAPTFIFLAGTSAYLLSRKLDRPALQRFLLTRGLWLVLLEFSVVSFVWSFNFLYKLGLVMQVIWATGISMCFLAGLVYLPTVAVGAVGVVMIAGHNLLDGIPPARFGGWAPLWNIIHVQGELPFGLALYPLVPWIGVMASGYAFGACYRLDGETRTRRQLALGAGLIALFLIVRGINVYGDLQPWAAQRDVLWTVMSFINVTKYPPSLAYVTMTLGPALLLLAAFEHLPGGRLARALETLGRVPMFAYVLHLAIAHLLAGVLGLVWLDTPVILTNIFVFYPDAWGVGLGSVYVAWLVVLACLYPLCRWFAALKRQRTDWWLAYL
ncbi:MAG: heparan-alpha-glucosaminide N-acetyltransferase domain-containing protein, partial [Polyangiales bacterium]